MKKIITNLKKLSLGIFATVLFAGSVNAATYTATTSGNWSSALTWGGSGSPGNSIGSLDNVVIPSGITVTLDMDVDVSSLLSYISVNGTLTSTTNSLTITQGTLQGAGTMNLFYVKIGNLGSMTFSGAMTASRFVNAGAAITISGSVVVNDSLMLNSGSLTFNTGSTLTMNSSSNIKIDAGSIAVNGGTLSAADVYDVIYVGSSKTSGIETDISSGMNNVWINMTDSSQTVTMGSDVTVSGTLYNTMGKLVVGSHTLKLMGDYTATVNGKIQGSSVSRVILQSASSLSSTMAFTSGSQFQYLQLNLGSAATANFGGDFSVDTMYVKNGTASFADASTLTMSTNGLFILENGTFTLGAGIFNGSNSYSVLYTRGNKISDFEISGPGLKNVTLNMFTAANFVSINSNLTITGMLNMNMGVLNLNSHSLYLNGTFSSTSNSSFQGNVSSSLVINNTSTAFGDTLNFTTGQAILDSLSINTMPSTWVWLGTGLTTENVVMQSGSIMLTNEDLTINSTGSIAGYDSSKYIGTSGSGALAMNVNAASPYVVFPIGTSVNYSPASIQIISGTSGVVRTKVDNGMPADGTIGANLALTQSVVNRTWYIQEPTQTGPLNASIKLEWKASEEMNSFDETHAFISNYDGSAWDASTASSATQASGSYNQLMRTNVNSFGPFAVVDQSATTGINKLTTDVNSALDMYPNPSSNFVMIDFKNVDAKSVELFDAIGNKVYSTEVLNKSTSQKLDISNLQAGVYYVKITTPTQAVLKKLIKS